MQKIARRIHFTVHFRNFSIFTVSNWSRGWRFTVPHSWYFSAFFRTVILSSPCEAHIQLPERRYIWNCITRPTSCKIRHHKNCSKESRLLALTNGYFPHWSDLPCSLLIGCLLWRHSVGEFWLANALHPLSRRGMLTCSLCRLLPLHTFWMLECRVEDSVILPSQLVKFTFSF